jgi:hypothetical protein
MLKEFFTERIKRQFACKQNDLRILRVIKQADSISSHKEYPVLGCKFPFAGFSDLLSWEEFLP